MHKENEEVNKKVEIITKKQNNKKEKKVKTKPEIVYYEKGKDKTLNKKKISIALGCLFVLLCIAIVFILYTANVNVRNFFDYKIFRKEIEENNLKTIEIQEPDKTTILAFSKYIAMLNENSLKLYNSSGKNEEELKIQISTPVLARNGEYMLIAEKDSSKAYLIQDNIIKWEKDLEGNISRVSVNENGYTAVVLSGTAYKSVIVLFNDTGSEIFRTYLGSTIAVDIDI